MRKTIGEVVDMIVPYANSIDVRIMHGVPFLKANISTISSFTRYWMYVVQIREHVYAACESRDDVHDRFFPSGVIDPPLVAEQDIIRSMFGVNNGDDISYKYETVKTEIPAGEFRSYLLGRLYKNEIIRFNPKHLQDRIGEMGFTSTRIRRAIEKEFDSKKCHMGTIEDLVSIVVDREETFDLTSLREKEFKVIVAKLRDLGVTLVMDRPCSICNLKFEKRKGG